MSEIDFKPTDIVLHAIPLVGTLGRTEREVAAAMLVRACAFHGDRWQPITPTQMGEWLRHDLDNKVEPFASLDRNPFIRPDFHELVRTGFAEGALEADSPLALTEKGLLAIARHRRPKAVAGGTDA